MNPPKLLFFFCLLLVISLSTGTAMADGPYSGPGCSAPTTTQQQSYSSPITYWCWGSGAVWDFPAGVGYFSDDGNCGPGQGYNAPCGECEQGLVWYWWTDGTCGPFTINAYIVGIVSGSKHMRGPAISYPASPGGVDSQPIDDRGIRIHRGMA